MTIAIIITSYNDLGVLATLKSLYSQEIYDKCLILIADGGSDRKYLERYLKEIENRGCLRTLLKVFPGSIAETRNEALKFLLEGKAPPKVICFIDGDERAPKNWLRKITEPILRGGYSFAFGPTRPILEGANFVTRYVYFDEARMYRMVEDGLLYYGAMGNSAWSSEMLRDLKEKYGYYINPELKMGGEDYELTLRALKEGYKGTFVKDAWLWHDQRRINSLRKLIKKKKRYLEGAYLSYKIVGIEKGGVREALRKYFRYGFRPLDFIILLLSIYILIKSKIYLHAKMR